MALTGAGTFSTNAAVTLSPMVASSPASGTLAKVGTGTLVLSGANTYTGATTVTAGILSIELRRGTRARHRDRATPGQLTFGGGTVTVTASMTLDANRGIAMTGVGTISTSPGVVLTYGGVIAGASTLTKAGTGTLVLQGTNTHTGVTAVTAGVVRA